MMFSNRCRDRDVVISAVAKKGIALKHAPAHMQVDRLVVNAAVNQNRKALLYVPPAHRKKYARAGPEQTRIFFKYMTYPFAFPEDIVERIVSMCHEA